MIQRVALVVALSAAVAAPTHPEGTKDQPTMVTSDFEFESGGLTLSGLLDQPGRGDARALVVFVHGYGPTNVREWRAFHDLRTRFSELGVASLVWDKPGQGRSQGEFDVDQPVESSAQEVLDAVKEVRLQGIPGSEKIGLWGISRAGWIAPLAVSRDPRIAFWISVSGVDDQENFPYLLESNWRIEGRTPEEVGRLCAEWRRGFEITSGGGAFSDYLAATENLRHDPLMLRFTGTADVSKTSFLAEQRLFVSGERQVDPDTGLMIYVPGFAKMLRGLDVDVLALFGERDTNVDWRKTRALYESTIGQNPRASLTVKTFPDGNHNIHRSETGGILEMEEMKERSPSEGYYQVQIDWLRQRVLGEAEPTRP